MILVYFSATVQMIVNDALAAMVSCSADARDVFLKCAHGERTIVARLIKKLSS